MYRLPDASTAIPPGLDSISGAVLTVIVAPPPAGFSHTTLLAESETKRLPARSTATPLGYVSPLTGTVVWTPAKLTLCACTEAAAPNVNNSAHTPVAKRKRHVALAAFGIVVTAEDFLPGVVRDVRLLSPEPAYTNVPRPLRVAIISFSVNR